MRFYRKIAFALACLWLFQPLPLKGEVNDDNDFQLWIYNAFVFPCRPKIKWYLETESRFGDNASQYFLFYAQTRLQFLLRENFEITPGYRQSLFLRLSDRKWEDVYIPMLETTCKLHLKGWRFADRNRLEYLIFDKRPNAWLYRNRLMVRTPWKLGKMGFNPIVFDEVFFREFRGFFENRLGWGGEAIVNEHFKITAYYMMRHIEIVERWNRTNVLWLMMEVTF